MGVKIVMTKDYPDYKAGDHLEVSEERADRWVNELRLAKYAEKKRAPRPPDPAPREQE